jgi:hypothetical protein
MLTPMGVIGKVWFGALGCWAAAEACRDRRQARAWSGDAPLDCLRRKHGARTSSEQRVPPPLCLLCRQRNCASPVYALIERELWQNGAIRSTVSIGRGGGSGEPFSYRVNVSLGSRTAVPAPHETFRYPIQKPPSGKRAVKLSAKSALGRSFPCRPTASHGSNTTSNGNHLPCPM